MKKILVLCAVLAAPVARAQVKIGFVDVQRAVAEVEEGKSAKARLKKELDDKRASLETKKGEFEKMREEYDKQSAVLSEEARRAREDEIRKKAIELQGLFEESQQDLSSKEAEAMKGILGKMETIIHDVSESEGLTFVLDKNSLLYAPAASDLTNEVIRRYNDKYGAPPAKKEASKKKGK